MNIRLRLLEEGRQSRSFFIISIILGVTGGILSILQAREISKLIAQVFLQGAGLEGVSSVIDIVLAIIVLRAGVTFGAEWSAGAAARRIKQVLRQRLYSHIVALGPAHLRDEAGEPEVQTGELTNLATEGIEALDAYFSQYLPQIFLAALVPTAILIFVFPTDLLTGVILLITAPLLPLFMYLISSLAQSLTRKQWRGLSRMSAYFLDVLQGLTTLKTLGRSKEQIEVIKKVSENYRQSTMGVLKVTFLSALVLELVATLSTAVVAVEIGIRLLYGKMAFEQAFFVLLLAPEFYLPLRTLGSRFHAGMAGAEAARRIFEILDLPVKTGTPGPGFLAPGEEDLQIFRGDSPPSLEFKGVSYTYSTNRPALQSVSFTAPAGKITALAGESGAGKTTLTWILLRFLQLQSGEIRVGERRLSDIPIQTWWDSLAWVSQNPYLFNDTVAANIKLARPDAGQAAVQRAARLAHAEEFIQGLSQGYDTVIGERGARLSAGQAQRIALARAFLKDAPLLILDEATSHLDPSLDAELQDSLSRLAQGRTALVIAHHRSTFSRADQMVTLSHGRLQQIEDLKSSTPPPPPPPNHPASQGSPVSESVRISGWLEPGTPVAKQPLKPPVGLRLVSLLAPFTGRILLSVLLGFATIASGIGLMATAAYI
ncbi:MAG: thiol reductant ABC exporter subunit CydD, partial [Chloroflexi bacterium RBG_16_54_11]